jgi:hypothetical protein
MECLVLLSRMMSATLVFAFFLAAPGSSIAQSLKSEEPMLTATLASDKKEYSLADNIHLDVRITNASRSELTVFGQLLWGQAGGLVLHVYDASNKEVPAKMLDDDMVVPSTLADRNSFVVLSRNHYLGTTRIEHLPDLVQKPGKYFIQVEYLSPVPTEFGQGPNFWSREKPPVWSNKIEVQVSKK